MTSEKAFAELKRGLPILKARIKDPNRMPVLLEMLRMSLAAYTSGDNRRGIFVLQEFRGIVWPIHALPVEYESEARLRLLERSDA